MATMLIGAQAVQISQLATDACLITNSGSSTVYLDTQTSVSSASYAIILSPGQSVNWSGKQNLYAVCSNGQSSTIAILLNGNTSISPVALGTATATALNRSVTLWQTDTLIVNAYSPPINVTEFDTLCITTDRTLYLEWTFATYSMYTNYVTNVRVGSNVVVQNVKIPADAVSLRVQNIDVSNSSEVLVRAYTSTPANDVPYYVSYSQTDPTTGTATFDYDLSGRHGYSKLTIIGAATTANQTCYIPMRSGNCVLTARTTSAGTLTAYMRDIAGTPYSPPVTVNNSIASVSFIMPPRPLQLLWTVSAVIPNQLFTLSFT